MKTFLLCIATPLFLISCSTDSDQEIEENVKNFSSKETISQLPENKTNPFDLKGKEFYKALNLYYEKNDFPNSIHEVSNQITFISDRLEKSNNTCKLIDFDDEIIKSIISNPDNMMIEIVQKSAHEAALKKSLISFLQKLIGSRQQGFNVRYDFIISYENAIMLDDAFSRDEKEAILTISSISRYSLYSEYKRKDRDWETSVGSKDPKLFFYRNEVSLVVVIVLLEKFI